MIAVILLSLMALTVGLIFLGFFGHERPEYAPYKKPRAYQRHIPIPAKRKGKK